VQIGYRANKRELQSLCLLKDGRKNLEKRVGVVTSDKMDKSIVVAEVRKVKHPLYGKFV
jgi:small subunit ribosomal protein S17